MKRTIVIIVSVCGIFLTACNTVQEKINLTELAKTVAQKGERYVNIEDYKGSVYMQGLAEMYFTTSDSYFKNKTLGLLDDFSNGNIVGKGNFISYFTGGNALVQAAYKGHDKYKETALRTADRMWAEQNRNRDGIMAPPWDEVKEKNTFFADIVLTVTPYFLYSGLIADNKEYIDYAADAVIYAYDKLLDPTSGLMNQAIGCRRMPEGVKTQDCWSRGNGWFSLALVALMRDFPKSHEDYEKICDISTDFYQAVLAHQTKEGLWNQEMTFEDAYTEISGSALLLYGLGSAIENGILPQKYMKEYRKGLKALMAYISENGDVGNTCSGCLAYRNGTKEDYASHLYYTNEAHSFGPVLLCLSQALKMGIKNIMIDFTMGAAIEDRIPECHVRFIEERKGDIAWENDFGAYRIYSQQVKDKVSSGVDYWTKYVDYPIIEKWYERNHNGIDYHTDRGEGWDFYAVGKNRGIGGSGIYSNGKLYVAEPYSEYTIISDTPELVDFNLKYPPYKVGNDTINESKRTRMVLGTHFYEVTSTISTESGKDAVLAIGLTNFGRATVERNPERFMLCLDEHISEKDGNIGGAIFVPSESFAGYAKDGNDELILMKVSSGESLTYYVGTGWSHDLRFDPYKSKWPNMLQRTSYEILHELYN